MKFRCERDVLAQVLATAERGTAWGDSARPVLTGVHLEAVDDLLVATGTDQDLTIHVTAPANVSEPGTALLPGRLGVDVVRSVDPGAVEVSVDDDEAHISSGRSQFSLRLPPADEFPVIGQPEGDEVRVAAAMLTDALSQVVMAASVEDTRIVYTGVLLTAEDDGLRLVATDTYRLAMRDLPGTTVLHRGEHVVVPSRALIELNRLLGLSKDEEVTVRLAEREVTFELAVEELAVRLTSQLIPLEFPNYRQAIPTANPNRLVVDRQRLLEAVKRVRLLIDDTKKHPIKLTQRTSSLELVAVSPTMGEAREEVDVTYDGEEMTLGFNPDYLIDGLEAADSDEVVLETLDARKPAVLRPSEGSDFFYLLMPRLI